MTILIYLLNFMFYFSVYKILHICLFFKYSFLKPFVFRHNNTHNHCMSWCFSSHHAPIEYIIDMHIGLLINTKFKLIQWLFKKLKLQFLGIIQILILLYHILLMFTILCNLEKCDLIVKIESGFMWFHVPFTAPRQKDLL